VFFPVLLDHEVDTRMAHEAMPTGVNSTKCVARMLCLCPKNDSGCIFEVVCGDYIIVCCRYVSQLWIRCLPVPVHTAEGSYTGSYSSLVAKMRHNRDPAEVEKILVC